jgi:hypothetical protein
MARSTCWAVPLGALLTLGCGRGTLGDADELGQAMGDLFASFDEAAQGGGFAARPYRFVPAPARPSRLERLWEGWVPSAWAAEPCALVPFTACADGVRTRTFSACTIGTATLQGEVTLSFSDVGCTFASEGDWLTRRANFTVTGPRGGQVEVSTPQLGQTVTRTAAGFSYQVDEIQRVGRGPGGAVLFDLTTTTLEALTLTGARRADRLLSGGKVQLRNARRGYTVVLTPEEVRWGEDCACPQSGLLVGEGVDPTPARAVTLELTGCGEGTLTVDGEQQAISFDRCARL